MPPIIASVSGGKDSTALVLWLREQGLEYRAVHMDTGWEHADTDRYLHEYLEPRVGPIEWITPPRCMSDLIRHKGMFPSRTRRFCTSDLKVKPLIAWMIEQYGYDIKPINAVGIRAAESPARAQLEEYEEHDWATTWRPLLRWAERDVIEIHHRHSILPNPLYLRGATRVGCWPCIFARVGEIANVAKQTPERIDLIRLLEAEVGCTFFHRAYGGSTSIDAVVKWVTRHDAQLSLFNDDDGCMRWGLCA